MNPYVPWLRLEHGQRSTGSRWGLCATRDVLNDAVNDGAQRSLPFAFERGAALALPELRSLLAGHDAPGGALRDLV